MNRIRRSLTWLALGTVLATSAASIACAVHGEARVRYYDRDREDWHYWDDREEDRYREYERHRHQEHRDFRDRNDDEKREYWKWRHSQP